MQVSAFGGDGARMEREGSGREKQKAEGKKDFREWSDGSMKSEGEGEGRMINRYLCL